MYITEHSYVSVKAKVSSTAQEVLRVVAEKIQHAEEDLALVAVSFSGGERDSVPPRGVGSWHLYRVNNVPAACPLGSASGWTQGP